MNLPWVSRTQLEQARQSATQAYDRLDIALGEIEKLTLYAEKANNRYESLVSRMLELKKDGFVQTPIRQPLKPAESVIPPEIEFAIEERASGDPFLRRHLNSWAQKQLAGKQDNASIVHSIRFGEESEENEQ